ncbi:MAG: M42 family metallopeptidase [candidate division KSB1 bacterium]|nr:M42 family metallopeptidase [candidate division KSB1 bacterium]MDZ7335006.1 M42 family metallopeptidase [candidate division KSB1 bacterium]MDZ7358108.1 M42 family metallopeptidase [candidate division KSB1 bacterium]MDZ7400185.1 M42 family metallopeptidase [candidate division KSB1 bacterium]
MNPSLEFLQQLSNSFGPSGFEREAIQIAKNYVEPFCDEIYFDKLGSCLFKKIGSTSRPIILLPGHIDEIGFVISSINEKGFLSFNTIGDWFDQVLLGQRVIVRTKRGDIPGVIAAKPPHVMTTEEMNKLVKLDEMFIDIGCSNKKEAEKLGVRIGDPVIPFSNFSTFQKQGYEIENGKVIEKGTITLAMGKAFDDRIGVFIAAEVVRRLKEEGRSHPNTVIGVATIQEEVGARGARTAAWLADPDVCLTLEVEIAGDIPGVDSQKAQAVLGKGPAICAYDASMIPNQALKEFIIEVAEKNNIPYQFATSAGGGTDAGAIHLVRAGCPSIVLGVPTRHIHSHVGILCLDDVEQTIQLVLHVIQTLDTRTATSFISV